MKFSECYKDEKSKRIAYLSLLNDVMSEFIAIRDDLKDEPTHIIATGILCGLHKLCSIYIIGVNLDLDVAKDKDFEQYIQAILNDERVVSVEGTIELIERLIDIYFTEDLAVAEAMVNAKH